MCFLLAVVNSIYESHKNCMNEYSKIQHLKKYLNYTIYLYIWQTLQKSCVSLII